jgi:phosphoglycolate phosphatase
MAHPLVIFDLDGTLVDTAPDLIATLNAVVATEGVPPTAVDDARHLVGGGARLMIERALSAKSMPADKAKLDRLFDSFIAHYSEHIADASRPFPELDEALSQLAASGFRFAVCTNKLEGLSRRLLDALDLTSRFDFICGQDTFDFMKPDPRTLHRTIAASGGDPKRSVMIGDSITDVRTAKAAGIPVVAVEFGYSDIPVQSLGADRLIARFAQLPEAVNAVLRW